MSLATPIPEGFLPPPPESLAPKRNKGEYRDALDDLKEGMQEARRNEAAVEGLNTKISNLEATIENKEESSKREEELNRKIQELEAQLAQVNNPETDVSHEGGDRFWKMKCKLLQLKLEDAEQRSNKADLDKAKFQEQVYLGEAVDTKMAYKMTDIELDNVRLRRLNRLLSSQISEMEKMKPTADYLRSMAGLLNTHETYVNGILKECDALTVPPNYYNLPSTMPREEVYCGRCSMLLNESDRGDEYPKAVRQREGPLHAIPYKANPRDPKEGIGIERSDVINIEVPSRAIRENVLVTPAQIMRAEAANSTMPPQASWIHPEPVTYHTPFSIPVQSYDASPRTVSPPRQAQHIPVSASVRHNGNVGKSNIFHPQSRPFHQTPNPAGNKRIFTGSHWEPVPHASNTNTSIQGSVRRSS